MSLPRTPTKQKASEQSAFKDLSDTIKTKPQPSKKGDQPQETGSQEAAMQNLGSGEAAATSLLSLEERLVVQMERSMSMMAETMAKMQFDFQECMLRENGKWKAEIEKLIEDKCNQNNTPTQANVPMTNAATAAITPVEMASAPGRNPATTTSLLMLTPPTHQPARAVQHTQAEYARSEATERDSSEEEFHTTRRMGQHRRTLRPPARSNHFQNTKLDRWGISYDGDDDKLPVEEFVFRVEHLQQLHDVPWSIIMGDFHKLLKGKAQDWYWLHRRNHGVNSWHAFKTEMAKQFQTHQTDFDITKQLVERKQRHNESVEDYIHQMRKLHARLSSPMSEMELINVIKGNMGEEVARILYPMNIKSLPELSKEYHRAQRVFIKRRMYQQPSQNFQRPSRPVVNEIRATQNSLEEEEENMRELSIEEIR